MLAETHKGLWKFLWLHRCEADFHCVCSQGPLSLRSCFEYGVARFEAGAIVSGFSKH